MIKNICIMIVTAVFLSSCKVSFSAVTPTQKYDADIFIIPVEDYKK